MDTVRSLRNKFKRGVSPPPAGNPNPGAPNTTPAFCKLSSSNKNTVIGAIRPALSSAMGEPTVSGLAGIISDITQNPSTAAAKAADIQKLFPIVKGPGASNVNLSNPGAAAHFNANIINRVKSPTLEQQEQKGQLLMKSLQETSSPTSSSRSSRLDLLPAGGGRSKTRRSSKRSTKRKASRKATRSSKSKANRKSRKN